ncbi:MAG TPA: polyprenol phosphomannose-dependent alpha 1,6 mannosyltransferase MptB [Acidimicrobiales bacterium]
MLDRVGSRLGRLSMRAEAVRLRLMPRVALTQRVEADVAEDGDWSFLRRPALLGFIAVLSICVGASLPSSPFKYEMTGTWFFGVPAWPTTTLMLPGVVAVYGGMVLFVRVWFGLYQTLRARPNISIRPLAYMLALWILPLLAVAPLFSRDVFSYAAQGEMMSHHINPYHYGPGTLGSGPYVSGVDNLWLNTPAPYGPLFLLLAGWSATLSLHHALITVLLLRLQAVAGVALIAYCIPKLARSFGKDPGPAFVLAVLNPLTLLALVGGAHNDALMVGLLLAGVTAARARHPVWGVVLCALAASIKVPAAMGIVYVAWDWAGQGAQWRDRARMLVRAGLITVGVMGSLSLVSGLGWGWILNLGTPGTVRSWMAPATAVGLLISGTAHVLGIGVSLAGVLTLTRAIGLVAAAVIALYCLRHRDRMGLLMALGITMLAFVVLGPVVQPWYLTWGIIIVAPVATGRMLYAILGLSTVAPFIGLTGGADLLSQLVHTDPASMVLAVMVLWAVAIVPLGDWTTSWRIDRSRLPGLSASAQGAVLES